MKNISMNNVMYYCVFICLLAPIFGLISAVNAEESFGDPFGGGKLTNSNWKWQNEPPTWDIDKTREGFLTIDSEPNRNVWASDASHFLYQITDVDTFDVETHFFAKWDTSSGVNGLLVKSPSDNNWVTLKFWSRDANSRGHIQFQRKQAGMGRPDIQWRFGDWGDIEMSLRLKKDGDTYTAWYKASGDEDWMDIGEGTFALTPPLWLGIYSGVAAGSGKLEVGYEYFRDNLNVTDVEPEGKISTTWGMVKSRY